MWGGGGRIAPLADIAGCWAIPAISPDGTHVYVNNNAPGNTVTVISVAPPRFAQPGWKEEIVAQILAGVIDDAGGWIELGGHIVRVPPREPVEAILAALPTQLAQRLTPLLAVPPQGDQPELVLRQHLMRAISEYHEESRG